MSSNRQLRHAGPGEQPAQWSAAASQKPGGGHCGCHPQHHSRDRHRQFRKCPLAHPGSGYRETGCHQPDQVRRNLFDLVKVDHVCLPFKETSQDQHAPPGGRTMHRFWFTSCFFTSPTQQVIDLDLEFAGLSSFSYCRSNWLYVFTFMKCVCTSGISSNNHTMTLNVFQTVIFYICIHGGEFSESLMILNCALTSLNPRSL